MAHGHQTEVDRLLLDASYVQAAADAMQALSTPSRLRILARLVQGPTAVSELAEAVQMEGSAVSHQLRVLRHLGLVVGRREGRQILYELHDDHVAEMLQQVIAHVDHVRLGLAGRADAAATVGA
jgi:DNA-binding transcriptional ArsR family regulator